MGNCFSNGKIDKNEINKLEDLDLKTIERLPDYDFKGMKGYGKIYDIYDGDTCNLVFWYPPLNRYIKQRIRMAKYDTPEINPKVDFKGMTEEQIEKKKEEIEIEKKLATKARDEFRKIVNWDDNKKTSDVIWYEVTDIDRKWNRPVMMLWNINTPEKSINAIIHKKHAVDYDGKTKEHTWGNKRTTNTKYDRPMNAI